VVHPYSDKNLTALEVGASIFIKANKNLMRAAREFEFELVDFDKKEHSDFGVYDGEKFVVTNVNNGLWKWWYNLRLWWKFGYEGPKKTKDLSVGFSWTKSLYCSDLIISQLPRSHKRCQHAILPRKALPLDRRHFLRTQLYASDGHDGVGTPRFGRCLESFL
jgi:hypothetical protein